jgi:hypothetical protein
VTMHKIEFDPVPLAEATMARAVSLAPDDPDVGAYQDQVRDLRMAANERK